MPEAIRSWLDSAGKSRAALILGAGVLAIIAILAIARRAAEPEWVPLMPGLALEEVGKVTAHLDEEGVRYRLARGGNELLVAENEMARARVSLARDGLPARGRPGFELFDRPAWGMTDFTQRINYRRALEGELERTITQMRGVEAAQVHIALNESSGFRRASRPEAASVVLTLRTGARPGQELVDGITSLVASSVDGLASDKVTLLDNSGHLLSAAVEPGSADGMSRRHLQLRRDVESYLEQKAEALVADAAGPGNARIRVAADLNFDKIDRTTQTVDPDQQVTTQEERSEIVPGEGQVGAGSTAMSAAYETSRRIETFSGAAGNIRRVTVAVLLNESPSADGRDARVWAPAELARIETLVANAVGLDRTRGDQISVVSAPFVSSPVSAPTVEPIPSVFVRLPEYRNEIISVVGLLLAFVLGLQVLRVLRASVAATSAATVVSRQALAAAKVPELAAHADPAAVAAASPYAGLLARSAESPEMAARVLRAWMKDS
jgi:flagellar M-ring protein FliF